MDRIGGEADLRRTLGTLRYLKSLSAHHAAAKSEPGAKAEPEAATAHRPGSRQQACP